MQVFIENPGQETEQRRQQQQDKEEEETDGKMDRESKTFPSTIEDVDSMMILTLFLFIWRSLKKCGS